MSIRGKKLSHLLSVPPRTFARGSLHCLHIYGTSIRRHADAPKHFATTWHASLNSVRRILCLGAHSDDIEVAPKPFTAES
jgi:hypothetical protein